MNKLKIIIFTVMLLLIFLTGLFLVLSYWNEYKSEQWAASPQPPGKLVYIGKQAVYCTVMGSGSPPIIIQCGLGSSSPEWWHIQNELSQYTTVITYDRPGYGWSDYTNKERASTVINDELHSLLEKLKVKGPYILIGHSIGGFYMRHFASLHKHSVKAIILVEPFTANHFRLKKEIKGDIYNNLIDPYPVLVIASFLSKTGLLRLSNAVPYINVPQSVRPLINENYCRDDLFKTIFREYRKYLKQSSIDIKNTDPIPAVPLYLIRHNADKYRKELMQYALSYDEALKVENILTELYNATAALSPYGIIIESKTANFNIHMDNPEIIIRMTKKLIQ